MNWIRRHALITTLLLGLISAITGIVSWAIPDSRAWMGRNPGLGWTLAISFATATIWSLIRLDGIAQERNREVGELQERLSHLEVRAAAPTERDVRKFEELIDLWSLNGPILRKLELFSGRRWEGRFTDPFYEFCRQWAEVFFDNADFEAKYVEFFAACKGLEEWMSGNGAPTSGDSSNFIYTIADGDEREGGWPEFDRVRNEGLELLDRVLELRKEVERSGRQLGL
ncbi:hypothetical protein ABZ837_17595 [Streptomyces sp. NPDC047197]|uniref:hypothetical protein n=1 Tax=Streptomyces sp. NPDC047197 TaxID=3155477 RepID=UPI0033E9FD76